MSTPTVTEVTPRPRARRTRNVAITVAVAVVALATVAVGRSLTAGRTGSGPVARTGAPAATDPLTSLERRIAVNSDDVTAWQALAPAYVARANRTGDPADYDRAAHAVGEARRLAPDAVRTHVAAASYALGIHDFAAASVDADAALAAAPDDADALAAAVDAAVELGRYDAAAAHLQHLLDVKPGAAALARASYQRELYGDLAGARGAMARAEAAAGTAAERAAIAAYAGDVALAAGAVGDAAAAYERALTLEPLHVGAALGRARTQLAGGDLAGARATAAAVMARSPQPAAAALVADLADVAGDRTAAADARAVLAANTTLVASAGVTVDLEAALDAADHGDPATAVVLATRAHDTRATVFTADALGWALTRAGRAAEAVPYVEASLRLGTANAALRVHAAVTYAAVGRTGDATASLGGAFALAPWPAFFLRGTAASLADQLGVSVPPVWRP